MADQRTRTDSALLVQAESDPDCLVLHLAHHPHAEHIGRRLVIEPGGRHVLGRTADLFGPGVLADARISRRHLEVRPSGGDLHLRDLGSHNGTYLNGLRVQTANAHVGDVIALGGLLFVVGAEPRGHVRRPVRGLAGGSHAMAEVLAQIDMVAGRDTLVLLLGETGVGKEVVARHLHERSGRLGAFVPVNCGAIAPGVLQSELFGHARGAFSGAQGARTGLVAEAEGGTLFLDEIGEAPPELQVTLLRLLQDRSVRPVGANRAVQVDVRFVAATNRDLVKEAQNGAYREDLLARLYRWVVRIPPLRARREDIPHLVAHFVERFAGRPMPLDRGLALQLVSHPWPGNVRQLEALVERLVIDATSRQAATLTAPAWLESQLARATSPVDEPAAQRQSRPEPAELRARLVAADGNMKALAEQLGVSRNTLYRWFRELAIDPTEVRRGGE